MMNFRLSLCAIALVSLCLAACSSNPDRDSKRSRDKENVQLSESELRQEADKLYRDAHRSLESADYGEAVIKYDKLIARYPFSDYGTQGEMERIFAQYKNYQHDDAASAADRFLRDHPRHAKADYVQYLKGLIDSDRSSSLMSYLPVQTSKADVSNERAAFNNFALLIQKYPNSRYVADARKRMMFLRDRVAMHELSVVRYYYRRGAYLAAAKRAQELIADFPGAPASADALLLQEQSFKAIGLTTGADETAKLIAANPGLAKPTSEAATPKPAVTTPATTSAIPASNQLSAPPGIEPSAPQSAEQKKPEQKGFFTWFSGLFSRLDTTRPENSYTLIIPSSSAAAAPTAATAGGTVDSASSSAAPAAGTTQVLGHTLHVTVGPDEADQWHPADAAPKAAAPASTASGAAPTPATPSAAPLAAAPAAVSTATAAAPKPSEATPPSPQPPAAEQPGFFSRLAAGVRAVFDRDAPSVDAPAESGAPKK